MLFQNTLSFARYQDEKDPLKSFRKQFHFPKHEGKDSIYFSGNSLGLQPKQTKAALLFELNQWRQHGVDGHLSGEMPWVDYHKFLIPQTAHIVGAKPSEVVVMNTLTVNLHLLMISFYRPTSDRYKIIMEGSAFPSDQYAVASQVELHGYEPRDTIIEIFPRKGEQTLRTEDIITKIEQHGNEIALVLFAGVHYFTGQCFEMNAITEAGHKVGAKVGFDLAHAVGNVLLELHDWNVDFAVWCNYKYLNAGPGGSSGAFVHERNSHKNELPRLAGWWGHNGKQRFKMEKQFEPMPGAEGWQLSNPFILSFAATKVGLDLFYEATMPALREKSITLTGYLEFLIKELNKDWYRFKIITPSNPEERGCQLSIYVQKRGKELFNYLSENGVFCDWREDAQIGEEGVIRIAPTPMYNSYVDVFRFAELLKGYR